MYTKSSLSREMRIPRPSIPPQCMHFLLCLPFSHLTSAPPKLKVILVMLVLSLPTLTPQCMHLYLQPQNTQNLSSPRKSISRPITLLISSDRYCQIPTLVILLLPLSSLTPQCMHLCLRLPLDVRKILPIHGEAKPHVHGAAVSNHNALICDDGVQPEDEQEAYRPRVTHVLVEALDLGALVAEGWRKAAKFIVDLEADNTEEYSMHLLIWGITSKQTAWSICSERTLELDTCRLDQSEFRKRHVPYSLIFQYQHNDDCIGATATCEINKH